MMLSPDFTMLAIQELAALKQWVCWKRAWRGNEPTKVPLQTDGFSASTTDPTTWTTFRAVSKAVPTIGHDKGVGFVFTAADPYAGVDLDACREPKSGAIADWGMEIITELNSYTEISPSGTGVKIIAKGTLPRPGRKTALKSVAPMVTYKTAAIELYASKRYFTITAAHLGGTPKTIEPAQCALYALYLKYFGNAVAVAETSDAATTLPSSAGLKDDAVIEHARNAINGAHFRRLFDDGDTGRYGSASEADAGLCALLLFWCGNDVGQVDRLFRRSALCRSKWIERADYRERTIAFAASSKSDVFQRRPTRLEIRGEVHSA
jgi:primase-polymerase (primpol)-like protein